MSTYHHGNLRAALLGRAIDVIGEDGVEGLSLRKVAKDLGVSHAAPTRHFASKADLLTAIVRDAYAELTNAVFEDVERARIDDPTQRLNVMAQSTIRWALKNRAKFNVMTNPDVSRFADEALKAALKDFVDVLSNAVAEANDKGFRHGASVQTLLHYSVGAVLGIATLYTDDMMRSVLGLTDSETAIADLADQIIPLE